MSSPKFKMSLPIFLILILFFSTMSISGPSREETDAYKASYSYILEEKWEDAFLSFSEFLELYPNSKFGDDARFWSCYALEKSGKDIEDAFHCYEDFVKDYEKSNWSDDAKANMIQLGKKLEKMGRKEYGVIIREMEDSSNEDVAIAAIYALQNMGNEQSTEALLKLYDSKKNTKLRRKILFALSESKSPKAKAKLKEIALHDPDVTLRKQAVFWIGDHGKDEETANFLKKIAMTDKEQSIREQAVFAISEMPEGKGIPILMDLVIKETDPRVRKKAVFWIGDHGRGKKVTAFLKDIALHDKDREVREQAVFALSEQRNGEGMEALMQIVQSEADPHIRKKAVFWLGENAKTEDHIELLMYLAMNDPDQSVREQAVFGLAETSAGKGKPALKQIALSDIDENIRKKAIFWIGENARTAEDIQFLKDVLEKENNPEIQEQAMFGIAEAPHNLGIPVLIDVAKNHPSLRLRKKAIFWLGESNDKRAQEAILEIVNDI